MMSSGIEGLADRRAANALFGSGSKFAPAVFGLAMAGAVLWPVVQNWRETPRDSFPLSYYPMFTAKRSRLTRVTYLVGLDGAGQRHPLPYTVAGTGGLNQVRRQINRYVREGRERELARAAAAAVALSRDPVLRSIHTVQVVKGAYRLSDYFSGHREAFSEKVVATSEVERQRAS